MLRYFNQEKTTAQLIRGGVGSRVDGEWVPVFDAPVPIRIITPQPLSANDTQMLPDGEHVRDFLKAWHEEKVFPREGTKDADRLEYDGDRYQVFQADDRSTLGRFYAFVMRRLEPGTL